ncbi:MAG: response regulator [Candidatus Krumholzibacteriia bacterium]
MQNFRILIVDDEEPIANLLELSFRQEGMAVARARDGIDCMNKVASFQPDVIIMDIMMPRLDGVDATRLIRRNRSHAGTIVVALSARSDDETREHMRQAGANLFMRKPFVIARLVERVQQLLDARAQVG